MVIVITGPTAVGKTKLSIELAKKINGEIINADSTQVYRGLDIATAKVTIEEMDGIKHHLIDIKNIDEDYTVYDYQKDARLKIDEIIKKGKIPILVGGTGLYIKAALYDYQLEKEEKINTFYEEKTTEDLYKKLLEVDPKNTINSNNRSRIIRALNYYEVHKKPFSEKEKDSKLLYDVIFIGLTTNRKKLYDKINDRVDCMLKNGLMEEALSIYQKNIRTKAVMTPIGYKELFAYFDHLISKEEAYDEIKKRSRHYAKRQYTWFNNQMKINWFETNYEDFDKTIKEVEKFIKK